MKTIAYMRTAFIVSLLFGWQTLAFADDKPNIVLLVMDNFGYGEVGVYGGGELRGAPTPRIDSLAADGYQLTNFNVEAECTPSRSALITGRYGIRTRQRQDGPPRGVWYGITKWEITLAEMLSDSRPPTLPSVPGETPRFAFGWVFSHVPSNSESS